MIRILDLQFGTIKRRFTGVKCSLSSLKSNISPDGKYIISGSITGKVYFWEKISGELVEKEGFDLKFGNDPVYDIAWSPADHIIALCSFDRHHPIRVFCYEKTDEEEKKLEQLEKTKTEAMISKIGSIKDLFTTPKKPTIQTSFPSSTPAVVQELTIDSPSLVSPLKRPLPPVYEPKLSKMMLQFTNVLEKAALQKNLSTTESPVNKTDKM